MDGLATVRNKSSTFIKRLRLASHVLELIECRLESLEQLPIS